jgi:hypothetical protein
MRVALLPISERQKYSVHLSPPQPRALYLLATQLVVLHQRTRRIVAAQLTQCVMRQ